MLNASATTTQSSGATFFRARIGSLLAFLPLGVWSVVHIWNNLSAFQGADAWEKSVTSYAHPAAQVITAIVVLLPLVIHTIWGIGRLLSARPNNVRYGFYTNLKYAIQRLSAIGLLGFLGAHLWLAMIRPRFVEGHAEKFADISHEMHFHTPTLVVYVLGVLGVAYHLANGLHTFAMGWGVVASKRALKKLEWVILGFFVLLLLMGWGAVYALYSAGA
ncbi:succinate dehydrogenase [Pendulispora albinea]|uniref:Succinate dehydrogenase n=1 Tax=Pendulispora albinea TaxID=2741071 RepID=A0ABZ2LWB2_9BACT